MDYAYTYTYQSTPQGDPVTSLLSMSLNVLLIVAWWKIFAKAGLEGWKALVPFYNGYLQYKIAWSGKVFWQVLIIGFAGILAGTLLLLFSDMMILSILVLVATVVWMLVIQAKFCSRLARSFGKSTAFAVGLFFLNTIFTCILAFEQNEYQGPIE